jgi:hypothetical protein
MNFSGGFVINAWYVAVLIFTSLIVIEQDDRVENF